MFIVVHVFSNFLQHINIFVNKSLSSLDRVFESERGNPKIQCSPTLSMGKIVLENPNNSKVGLEQITCEKVGRLEATTVKLSEN